MARDRGIKVIHAVAERLPIKDSQFDFALMVTTICFLDDVDQEDLSQISAVEPVVEGYGKGAFVVIRASKP